MMRKRIRTPFRQVAAATLVAALAPPWAGAQEGYDLVEQLMAGPTKQRRAAAHAIVAAGDVALVPGIVDALFFTAIPLRGPMVRVLRELTGESLGTDYYAWVELVGRRDEITPREGYLEWKVALLSRIDPDYRKILYPGAPSRIRLEEVVWGGARLGEIPALDDPPRVGAAEAGFLSDGELVFGVGVGGAHHAYPHRYLSWHEMVNDVVGGEPITLSY